MSPGGTATTTPPPTTAEAGQPFIDWARPFTGGPNAVPDTAVNQAGVQAWGTGDFDRR